MISVFCGVFSFLILFFAIPHYLNIALLFASLFALGLMIVVPLVMLRDARKYRDIEKNIEGKILAKAKVNIRSTYTVRNGYLVLTEDCIHLFSRDKKPYMQESIPKEFVDRICFDGLTNLFVEAFDASFSLVSGECKEIARIMIEYDWNLK